MEINYSAIQNRSKELECFKGYLPSIIQMLINYDNYLNFLRKEGLFDNLSIQLAKSRHYSRAKRENEFMEWINDNPEYKDFIIE